MAPISYLAKTAGDHAHMRHTLTSGRTLGLREEAAEVIEKAGKVGPRVDGKTAAALSGEKDGRKLAAGLAASREEDVSREDATDAHLMEKADRELDRLQQESQGSQDLGGVVEMRRACWKLLDKTHQLGEESERNGLQHYGKDQSGIPIPMRLSGGHAMPLENIQEIVDDHESDS